MQGLSPLDQIIIEAFQRRGKMTKSELSLLTGLSIRRVRNKISELRMKNIPIISCSSQKGYWLASNRKECEIFAREMLHRVNEMQKVANGVLSDEGEKYYQSENQISLF